MCYRVRYHLAIVAGSRDTIIKMNLLNQVAQ